jgi:hypothetical protein
LTKIGFIFFDGLHIIHHFIGPAVALHKESGIEVAIITDEREHLYLFSLLKMLKAPKSMVKKIPTYRYRKIIEKIKKRKQPSSKYLFEKNKDFLLGYDILVFNDANHEYLYNQRKGDKPKFVMLMHGAGDGAYLIGEAHKDLVSKFDLITTSGNKVTEFFKAMGGFTRTKFEVCGYQKFDIVKIENEGVQYFDNAKPTVLYNPHFKEELSSWYRFGKEVLEYFYQQNEFNLIFAPHINLFNKKGFLDASIIAKKYFNKENIIIDLGSEKSVNMSYTLQADLYIGDVSSQVYEFLQTPKPCIFINAHAINWRHDKHYQNWHLGKVVLNIDTLEELINTRLIWQKDFKQKQLKAMAYTFDISPTKTATQRVSEAILKYR